MSATTITNPFHPEAVAVYGQTLKKSAHLKCMTKPREELESYLIAYHDSQKRYGAAIGLRGSHGSGKTHLLSWLAQTAQQLTRIQPVVLYAKADGASFFDLYVQLLEELSRERLQLLLVEALQKTAIEHVSKAKATESIKERITSPEDLPRLYEEESLDRDYLLFRLQTKLESLLQTEPEDTPQIDAPDASGDPSVLAEPEDERPTRTKRTKVPVEIPRTLMQINDPNHGEKAYQWLLGKDVAGLEALGLRHSLLQIDQQRMGSSTPDATAVNALEAIAALFCLAERPLIILIDQLEVFLPAVKARQDTLISLTKTLIEELGGQAEKARQDTRFSLTKKLIEQLGCQKALMFIAGNNESWETLPPDVPPRLRNREPFRVGNLDLKETSALLESYADELPPDASRFTPGDMNAIYELADGSPREAIRIAYYAFKAAKGDLGMLNNKMIVESAKQSGSVSDRNRIALSIADSVLENLGPASSLFKDLDVGEGVLLSRLLKIDGRASIALTTVKATDQIAEIDSARRVNEIRRYLARAWQSTPLIVVTVGYSSQEVEKLLGATTSVLQFHEASFAGQLKTKALELIAQQPAAKPPEPSADNLVLETLRKVDDLLASLKTERSEKVQRVADRFAEQTETLSEPARVELELHTRWDLIDALDTLQVTLRNEDLERERELMRAILVTNEAYLRIKHFDYLGGVYLDLLSEQNGVKEYVRALPPPETKTTEDDLLRNAAIRLPWDEAIKSRRRIISELRRLLRGLRLIDKWFERPWPYSLSASGILAVIVTFLEMFQIGRGYDPEYWSFGRFIYLIFPNILILVLIVVGGTFLLRWLRFKRWEFSINRVRRLARKI